MSDYSENRSFSDAYTNRICGIVGPHLLTKAPYEIDTQQATDLVVIRSGKKAFIGIERERKYFDIACERIARAQAQGQLLPAEPQEKPQQAGMVL